MRFKDEDFKVLENYGGMWFIEGVTERATEIANAKLEAWLAAAPVVFEEALNYNIKNTIWVKSCVTGKQYRMAKLVQIEELPGTTEGSEQ